MSMQDELNLTVRTVYTDSSLPGKNVPSAGFSVYINQTPYEVSGITLQNGEAAIKIPVSEANSKSVIIISIDFNFAICIFGGTSFSGKQNRDSKSNCRKDAV